MAVLRTTKGYNLDRVLAGRPVGPGEADLLKVVGAVRAIYDRGPSPQVERRHVAALVAAPPAAADPPKTVRVTAGRPPVARPALHHLFAACAALFALPLSLAGLAVAGVDLPDPADSAFERVGLELPNQSDSARSGDVKQAIDASEPSERDCTLRQLVAAAARAGRGQGPAKDPCAPRNESASDKSESGTNQGASQKGASGGGAAGQGAANNPTTGLTFPPAQSGREFGAQVSQNARAGSPNSSPNPTAGVTPPPQQSGQDYGQEVAENARKHGPGAGQ